LHTGEYLGSAGKLIPVLAGVEVMKTTIHEGSRQIKVDTRHDECLYAAPRPQKGSEMPYWVKDLYMHEGPEKKNTYYLHLWSTDTATKDKIMPVSPATMERFMRSKGLVCNLFPKCNPIETLYAMGYGIAEEF
jgi:hypothetical protein